MPIYEYEAVSPGRKCRKCSTVFEIIQRISDSPLASCPDCRREVRRRISRPRVILPGSALGAPAKVQSALLEVMQERQVTYRWRDFQGPRTVPGNGHPEPD